MLPVKVCAERTVIAHWTYQHLVSIVTVPVNQIESSNPLSNDKILDLSKFKAFADDKIIVTQKLKFVLGRVENFVGKGENAGSFSPFPTMVSKAFFPRGVKSRDCVVKD